MISRYCSNCFWRHTLYINICDFWCLTSKDSWYRWAWPSIWKINWSNIESLEKVTLLWRLLFYERCFEGIRSLWNEFMLFILPLTEWDITAVTHDCCHLSTVHYIPVRLRIQHFWKVLRCASWKEKASNFLHIKILSLFLYKTGRLMFWMHFIKWSHWYA